MKHEKCQQYVGRMYVKVGHDVQAQTILKVKLVGWLVFIGSSFYECNDIFDTSRIWLLVSGKDQKNVLVFHDNCWPRWCWLSHCLRWLMVATEGKLVRRRCIPGFLHIVVITKGLMSPWGDHNQYWGVEGHHWVGLHPGLCQRCPLIQRCKTHFCYCQCCCWCVGVAGGVQALGYGVGLANHRIAKVEADADPEADAFCGAG